MLWGIKYLTDWRDYWDWDDWEHWDGDPTPIRFDTQEDADKDMCIREFVEAFDRYERTLPRLWLNGELRRMRVEALENAGLINHPYESKGKGVFSPIISYGAMYRKPVFNRDKYKSVPDAEMDEPTAHYEGYAEENWKYSKWNTNGN
jgi:hypothetical protein